MANFLTRVELHGSPTSADYDRLHREMEQRLFWRTARVEESGPRFWMPTAEYHFTSATKGPAAVCNLAIAAANAIGYVVWSAAAPAKACSVTTVEWSQLAWNGLKPV
jgi:hypothetical protein